MSTPLELRIDCGQGISLSTNFWFAQGRYRHSIELRGPDNELWNQWNDEIESRSDDWPGSPPIQQLSLESIKDRPALLGVGQAGKSHWSISVETMLHKSQPALKFDLACRCRTAPSWLGSTYRRSGQPITTKALLSFLSNAAVEENDQEWKCKLSIDQASSLKYPTTFQWSYLVNASIF